MKLHTLSGESSQKSVLSEEYSFGECVHRESRSPDQKNFSAVLQNFQNNGRDRMPRSSSSLTAQPQTVNPPAFWYLNAELVPGCLIEIANPRSKRLNL